MTKQDIETNYRNVQYTNIEHLIFYAIEINVDALNYVEQTQDVCQHAIEVYGKEAFELIKNPTEFICIYAIAFNSECYNLIPTNIKTFSFNIRAIDANNSVIPYIKDMNYELCIKAICINPFTIQFFKDINLTHDQYTDLAIRAINLNEYAISHVVQTKELVELALQKNINTVNKIKTKNKILKSLFNSKDKSKMMLGINLWKNSFKL